MSLNVTATPNIAENPLVSALGQAIGMGPLLTSAAGTAADQLKPPAVAPSETERVRDSRNVRQSYPKATAPRGSQPGVNGANVGMNLPGVMSPDVLMHPAVQELLGNYGITPEQLQQTVQNASPNLFVNNPQAYEKHPVLANMAERGLEGLAFTQGSHTWGEGLSNVAQGMLNAKAARADRYNNMLMMPFMQAQQVAGMKNIMSEEQLKQAQIMYDQAHANYFDMLPELRQQMLDQSNQYHQGMINMRMQALNERKMMDPRLGYLTPEQSEDLQHAIQSDDFDWDNFEKFGQMGQANKDKMTADLKTRLAKISGSFRLAASNNSIDKTLESISARGDVQDALRGEQDAVKAQDDFMKSLDSDRAATDLEGNLVAPGDRDAINHARALFKKAYDDKYQATQSLLTNLMGSSSAPDARRASKTNQNDPFGLR